MITDWFFYADFWYRNEFTPPRSTAGQKVWPTDAGVAGKPHGLLNGEKLGHVEGAMSRARFDVTGELGLSLPGRGRRPHTEERHSRRR